MSITVYNSLTRQKEPFNTLEPNKVRMYACGITASGDAHIGHAYQSVVFDMIKRYLEYRGYEVTYVRNYTDVDDKIIARANEKNMNAMDYANALIAKTDKELDALGSQRPTIQSRATECIPDIIAFIEKLIEKGMAYATEFGDVYYKVALFKDYGKLSKVDRDENLSGVRKEVEPGKLDDKDFALWKSAKPGEISWDSPWGKGRPGWHIECSAMSMKYLGETIDIHGGGRDLIFPHHENEIAQSEALTGKTFANYWIHNGLLKINGQKMSKSLGNSILLQDLLAEYDSDVLRFGLLKALYASDINITDNLFAEAEKHIYRFYQLIQQVNALEATDTPATATLIAEMAKEFEEAMDDNFNTAVAFALLFKYMDLIQAQLVKKVPAYNLKQVLAQIQKMYGVFGILQKEPATVLERVREKALQKSGLSVAEIEAEIAKRVAAKADKDYAAADAIRQALEAKGIALKDTKDGTIWDVV